MVSPYGYIVCRWSYVTCIPSNRIQTILSISSQFISLSRTISIHLRVARPLERYPTSFLPFSDRVTQPNYVRACLHLKLLRATTRRSKRYQPICAPPPPPLFLNRHIFTIRFRIQVSRRSLAAVSTMVARSYNKSKCDRDARGRQAGRRTLARTRLQRRVDTLASYSVVVLRND